MTKTLERKIIETVKKADNYAPIKIHHYGNDYDIVFRIDSDGTRLFYTGYSQPTHKHNSIRRIKDHLAAKSIDGRT